MRHLHAIGDINKETNEWMNEKNSAHAQSTIRLLCTQIEKSRAKELFNDLQRAGKKESWNKHKII